MPDAFELRHGTVALTISIIVPVLNEAPHLADFLQRLRVHAPLAEIIVADGGSTDGSWKTACAFASEHGTQLIRAPRGRAAQMNAAATLATGDVLWFLHADSVLPAGCITALLAGLKEPALVGGCFRLRLRGSRLIYRVSDSLGNIGVDLFRIALGDHGIFCRRETFQKLGGYPEVALMEDALFYESMQRRGRVRQLRPKIATSPRVYEKLGPWRTTAHYLAILLLYVLRAPAAWQEGVFAHLHRTPRRGAANAGGFSKASADAGVKKQRSRGMGRVGFEPTKA